MNWGVENGDFCGDHWYMNIHTIFEANNHNSIDDTKKRDENVPNLSEMENNWLQDGVEIDVMLPASKIHQYYDM